MDLQRPGEKYTNAIIMVTIGFDLLLCILVHKRMYWIQMNLQMLQPSNVFVTFECLYYVQHNSAGILVLGAYISSEFIIVSFIKPL